MAACAWGLDLACWRITVTLGFNLSASPNHMKPTNPEPPAPANARTKPTQRMIHPSRTKSVNGMSLRGSILADNQSESTIFTIPLAVSRPQDHVGPDILKRARNAKRRSAVVLCFPPDSGQFDQHFHG